MTQYYDWHKTRSYNADVTMVIGARGIGKTYGLRLACIRDFLKKGYRFCEVVRYKSELFKVADGYFNKLQKEREFRKYVFRTDTKHMYIAEDVEGETDEKGRKLKPDWKVLGYFVAMTDQQTIKKMSSNFDNVRSLIFDEAVIDHTDRFHTYLASEPIKLAGIVDSVTRERGDNDSLRPHLYLLGNACDIANPYFIYYKVGTDLTYGYRWYGKKSFLLHYVQDIGYAEEKLAGTVAGRMLAINDAGNESAYNEFYVQTDEYVFKKPRRATFEYGIVMNGKRFGIWYDRSEGYIYVTNKIPKNSEDRTYALTVGDSRFNMLIANRATKMMKSLGEMYWAGIVLYDSVQVKTDFLEVLTLFGVK